MNIEQKHRSHKSKEISTSRDFGGNKVKQLVGQTSRQMTANNFLKSDDQKENITKKKPLVIETKV